MPTAARATGLRLWLALGVIYVIWGSTYFGIAIAIKTVPPFFMAAIRFVIAGAALVAWDLVRSPEARHWPSRRQLLDSVIVGGLLLAVGNGFVALGERTVPSGIAAILIGMMPVWFVVLGWLYFRERPGPIVGLGIVVGFAGVAALVWPTGTGANHFDAFGLVVLLLAPLGWAHGSLYAARKAHLPHRPLIASGLQMLAASVLLLVEGFLIGEGGTFDPSAISPESILAILYLAAFGSMLAYTTYGWLLRHAPLSLIGTYAYVNPVVAVGLGTLFLAEPISLRTLVSSAVIIGAVAMIVTARGRVSRAEATPSEEAGADPATTADELGLRRGVVTAASVNPLSTTPRAPSG
ncbi:MAG TPA: EamA family transporter [Candidatus Limnocylindrales bacterium]|nr:EamA family transporter [Candidatus Limnocylindrales bacterium]